jgi:hypothetical protein
MDWRSLGQYRATGDGATARLPVQIRPAPTLCLNDSQIRPRVSQIAAALLFDFRKVDIRRVGTHQKRILVVGCSDEKL